MSANEIEAKCRELRQLQNLIAKAEQEVEAIKDALKDHMGGQRGIVRRGVHGDVEAGKVLPCGRCGPA